MPSLPAPECALGYTLDQVEDFLLAWPGQRGRRIKHFERWMAGQTMAICNDHGTIIYRHDLERYLAGLPVVD